MLRLAIFAGCALLWELGELPFSRAFAADRCTGLCEYCAVWSGQRGCARCAVDGNCLNRLKSPKLKYKSVPIPETRAPRLPRPAP
jgi:hypothetical protein